MRHAYSVLSIATRHPHLFQKLHASWRLDFWPTAKDGTHVVIISNTHEVRQVGVLWK